MKTVLIILGVIAALFLLGDLVRLVIAYVRRKKEILSETERLLDKDAMRAPDFAKRRSDEAGDGKVRQTASGAAAAGGDTGIPEEKLRFAESVLESCGAVPTDLNARNRELLGQRITYRYGALFYRIDQAVFDGKSFLILNCADSERFAGIGLMEDVEAIDPDLSDDGIAAVIRAALEADAGGTEG